MVVGWPRSTDRWFPNPSYSNGYFGERRPVVKPRGRRDDALESDTVYSLQTRDGKAAARTTEGWRKVIGEAMARKRAEVPPQKYKYTYI